MDIQPQRKLRSEEEKRKTINKYWLIDAKFLSDFRIEVKIFAQSEKFETFCYFWHHIFHLFLLEYTSFRLFFSNFSKKC